LLRRLLAVWQEWSRRLAVGANVAAAIAAAVGVEGAQLQAAPQQASHVALPLDSLLDALQGGAGNGTAPTSIEGSRRAHFPILTHGVVTRNNFMARPWVHHGPMRGPCVCPSWALKARAWANAHVGDGRPKRRPREAQAWALRGLTKTLCKWIRKWLRAVVACTDAPKDPSPMTGPNLLADA